MLTLVISVKYLDSKTSLIFPENSSGLEKTITKSSEFC